MTEAALTWSCRGVLRYVQGVCVLDAGKEGAGQMPFGNARVLAGPSGEDLQLDGQRVLVQVTFLDWGP